MTLELAQPLGRLCEGPGGIDQRLGQGLSRASPIETAETTRPHAQRHGLTLPGQIMERTLIMVANAPANDGRPGKALSANAG